MKRETTNLIFFGSTDNSVIVAEKLHTAGYPISGVVTQPPKPVGRKQVVTPTPVEIWANGHDIAVLSFAADPKKPWCFADDENVINAVETFRPDLLVSACFGQKIPSQLIAHTTHGGLNIHPSLLPRWRGADPVPWTILSGDRQTGVTIVTLSEKFDQGKILAAKKIPVKDSDFPDALRTSLFRLGAELLIETLPEHISGKNKGIVQKQEDATRARKLTRDDGYIPWEILKAALTGQDLPREQRPAGSILSLVPYPLSPATNRIHRALFSWPGIWTKILCKTPGLQSFRELRLKLLDLHMEGGKLVFDTVQLEGKNPVPWEEFSRAYEIR